MSLTPDPGGVGTDPTVDNYFLVSLGPVPRVSSDTNVETVIQIAARSKLYGVTYTWFMDLKTYKADGEVAAAELKTAEVNTICGHDHVIGFRSEQDTDASNLLVNNAVITVGTEDGRIQDYVTVRMDSIDQPSVFQAIDDLWTKLVKAGAS